MEENLFAEEPLHPDLVPYIQKGELGQTLHHPLIIQIFYNPLLNHICNQQYKHKTEYIENALQNKEWNKVIWMYERPYRLEKFIEIQNELSDQEYWQIFGSIWSDSENLWQYKFLLEHLLNVNRSNRSAMMEDYEQEFLKNLPEEFIVYRGHQGKNRLGHSWTMSYWKAKWFATRHKQKNFGVAQAIVSKKDIIAVLLGRSEYEIVVSPTKLKNISTVSKTRRPDWLELLKTEFEQNFYNKRHSHHGPWHWEKVEKNAIALSAKTSGADRKIAQLFALIHDSKRINEDYDPEHGLRAAQYAKQLFEAGRLQITSKQLEILMEACEFHDKGLISKNPTIGVCWDADRLDLPRVGITPEVQYLSTEAAKDLLWKI